MAGIEHSKAALAEVGEILKGLKAILPDGLGFNDIGAAIQCGKDAYDLYSEAMKAKEDGEISDLDLEEIRALFSELSSIVGDLLKPAA